MIKGPAEYVPTVESEIVKRHKAIPLDETEGIYVRDIKTGKVRAVVGQTYMLTENEELWEKELSGDTNLIRRESPKRKSAGSSDEYSISDEYFSFIPPKARCVTLEVPHNSAVQLYDYKLKTSRVIFGPELVILEPDEQFTVLSLSYLFFTIFFYPFYNFFYICFSLKKISHIFVLLFLFYIFWRTN